MLLEIPQEKFRIQFSRTNNRKGPGKRNCTQGAINKGIVSFRSVSFSFASFRFGFVLFRFIVFGVCLLYWKSCPRRPVSDSHQRLCATGCCRMNDRCRRRGQTDTYHSGRPPPRTPPVKWQWLVTCSSGTRVRRLTQIGAVR